MALMLLPHWTDGCMASMEGLFFEASGTTPYHFLTTAAMSKQSSNPVRELRYDNNDAAKGVPYLQALGVRYVMVRTDEAKRSAEAQPELTLLATSGPWEIYQVADSAIVQPLDRATRGRRSGATATSASATSSSARAGSSTATSGRRCPPTTGPTSWQRIDVDVDQSRLVPDPNRSADDPDTRGKQVDIVVPREPIEPVALPEVTVSDVVVGEQDLSFSVDQVGVPVLVKVVVLPELDGARGRGAVPHRAEPDGRRADRAGRLVDVRPQLVGPRLLRPDAARDRSARGVPDPRRRRPRTEPAPSPARSTAPPPPSPPWPDPFGDPAAVVGAAGGRRARRQRSSR